MRWSTVFGRSAVFRGGGHYLPRWRQVELSVAGAFGAMSAVFFLIVGDTSWIVKSSLVVVSACASVYVLRRARIFVAVDHRGVVIRNEWRRYLVSWKEFDAFVFVTSTLQTGGYVQTLDGSRFPCSILCVGGRREIQEHIEEMNQVVARLRPAEPAG